jgi:hypothetical protein
MKIVPYIDTGQSTLNHCTLRISINYPNGDGFSPNGGAGGKPQV